jgi:hypothetical protein
MTVDQVRRTLRERIARGAPLSEIDTLLRMSRGLGQRQREALWAEAVRYDPRGVTRRQVNTARRFLGRTIGEGGAPGKPAASRRAPSPNGRPASRNGRAARRAAASRPAASRNGRPVARAAAPSRPRRVA